MRLRWALNLNPAAARAIVTAAEAMPGNPSRAEEHHRGGRRHGGRVTPRYAIEHNPDGTVDVGVPMDGWAEGALLRASPLLQIVDGRARRSDT